jgi:hypothetical protein
LEAVSFNWDMFVDTSFVIISAITLFDLIYLVSIIW